MGTAGSPSTRLRLTPPVAERILPRATSWLIDHGKLIGDTAEAEVWSNLADFVTAPIAGMLIRLALVDSGFQPGGPDIDVPLTSPHRFGPA